MSLINELFAFCLFAGVIYFIGQQRGGRGTFQDIAYTFALFYVPIQVLTWAIAWLAILTPIGNVLLPWLWLIQLAGYCAQAFYAHLAVKGVMGFQHRKDAWIAVIVGLVTILIIQAMLSRAQFASF